MPAQAQEQHAAEPHDAERVTVSVVDGVAHVRLNRPDKRNALDNAMFLAIADAGERVKVAPSVRVVVLSGEGASFCAGLDFTSFQSMASTSTPAGRTAGESAGESDGEIASVSAREEGSPATMTAGRITHLGQQVAWVWQEIEVPVIAAVHGHALGGGLQIALGADIRIIHPDTKLSVRELHWGLVPDMTGTQVLASLVRPDVAKELTFTARVFSGTEAFELGIATRLSENPLDDAMAMAGEIAGRSPQAMRGAKHLFNRIVNFGAVEQFAHERTVIGSLIGRPNQVEAVMANFENRPAKFSDPA
ncbi:MAG: crotonase/enoyl-CoA hydratase family protein [Ilumatobacteraceae bacterium]